MLTKSEKSNGCPGVAGKRRLLPPAPPGVVIMEDGKPGSLLGGGVDGGSILDLLFTAGDGDAARYSSRSAPSSLLPFSFSLLRRFRDRVRIGGVLGGEAWLRLTWKECIGSRSSSSSDKGVTKLGEARSTDTRRVPWKKETSGPFEVVKCCCLRGLIGDDWIN